MLIDDQATETIEDSGGRLALLEVVKEHSVVSVSTGTYTETAVPVPIANLRAAELLREWVVEDSLGDADEQRREWERLKRALDEHRLSDRRFFK